MNLVEATIDGDDVAFGQFRGRTRPGTSSGNERVRARDSGIRPESFEDATYAPDDLPRIDVEVVVLEELGSDAHVFFRVDAPGITPDALDAEGEGDGGARR